MFEQSIASVSELYSPSHTQHLLMQYEAAMARVQSRHDIIPAAAAAEITRTASVAHVPLEAVDRERLNVGHPMVSLLNAWSKVLQGDAAQWLHYGATTQDIHDTVQLYQLRTAARHLSAQLREAEAAMLHLAAAHRSTPMIGRTVGRHALPITFGLKVSSWLAENRRSIARLASWAARSDTGMLSGAVGSYAALGEEAFALEAEVLRELGVGEPLSVDWKGSRDMHAEYGGIASLVAGTWRKIAQEVFLLQGDDIRELEDPNNFVGSSTMPHKQNPDNARKIVAIARSIPHHAAVLYDWMVSIHERDQISNADALGPLAIDLDRMMQLAIRMVSSLVVRPDNMRANLGRTRGLIMAEAAMFVLGQHIGKMDAHAVVRRAAREATRDNCTLTQALATQPEVIPLAAGIDFAKLLEPADYVGLAPAVVDRTIAFIEAARELD